MALASFAKFWSKGCVGGRQRTKMFVLGHNLDHEIRAGDVDIRIPVKEQKSGEGTRMRTMRL